MILHENFLQPMPFLPNLSFAAFAFGDVDRASARAVQSVTSPEKQFFQHLPRDRVCNLPLQAVLCRPRGLRQATLSCEKT